MKYLNRFAVALGVVFLLLGQTTPVFAKPAAALNIDTVSRPQTPLPIADELQKQLQSLIGSSAPTPVSEETSDETNVEPTPTFGTRALSFVIAVAGIVRQQTSSFVTNFAALPELSDWLDQQNTDRRLQTRWASIGDDLVASVVIPLLGAILLELLLFPLRLVLRRKEATSLSGRLAIIGALFCLRALPILGFVIAGAALLDQNNVQKLSRFIAQNIIYAFALTRITISLFRGLLAPRIAALRIVPLSNEQAVYSFRWLSAFSILIICGYFFRDVADAIRIPSAAIASLGIMLGLILVGMMITIIIQKQSVVAILLRGHGDVTQPPSLFQSLRQWFAKRWHIITIAYLVVGYLIAALGVANGLIIMLRGTISTFLILIALRLLSGLIDRRRDSPNGGAARRSLFAAVLTFVLWILAIVAIVASWGLDLETLFATPLGQRILGSLFSISVTMIGLGSLYELLSGAMDRHLNRRADDGDALRASARVRTLLPMIRNVLFMVFAVIFAIVVLSEVGVNVGPLLAGAGVLGVAVGFGSQTLVKDLLTGFFIVVENAIAIGDYVKIAEHQGWVESIGIRTVRLRDREGSLHLLPFSEVTKITNMTKDFAFAMIEVGVSYNTDLVKAMNVMREVGAELQKDPIYKRTILDPIDVWGVDKLGDSSIILMGRMRTRPGKQWDVRRTFLLRLKLKFDQEGIVIPYPTVLNIHQDNARPA
jgi:small conductance mechanosensitive channel